MKIAEKFKKITIPEKYRKKKFILPAIFFVIALAAAVYFGWFKNNPPVDAGAAEVKSLVKAVSRLMVLPEGETPTVATVTDLEQLRDQPFFAKAKVGDRVLIYTGARKVILYDPLANKIVEVANINIDLPSSPE